MPLSKYSHEELVELMRGVACDGRLAERSRDRIAATWRLTQALDGENYEAWEVFNDLRNAGGLAEDWLGTYAEEENENAPF